MVEITASPETQSLVRPAMLRPGDTIAAISLSSGAAAVFPRRYAAGVAQLERAFGVRVVPTANALRDSAWLARNPQARAEDLMTAFADPAIKGIVATIGGDDSIRTLRYTDLAVIRANPKVFMGFSDTTVTHFACYAAGLISFHGPCMMVGIAENGGMLDTVEQSIRRTLFAAEPVGVLRAADAWTVEFLDWANPANQDRRRTLTPSNGWRWLQGETAVEGRSSGGCIEVLDWLRGTTVWPSPEQWNGAVLFLETSEEAPSPQAVTRMLRSLAACGALERAAALLFGRPGGGVSEAEFAAYDNALLAVIRDELGRTDMPVVTRMDFGHTEPNIVLPFGVRTRVDPLTRTVTILESAVRAN